MHNAHTNAHADKHTRTHTHASWFAVSAAGGQEGRLLSLCRECKDRIQPIKPQLLPVVRYTIPSYSLTTLPPFALLLSLFVSVLPSLLDFATSCLSSCQPSPSMHLLLFSTILYPSPLASPFSLSLIKTVPRSSPRREEEDKNSSASAWAHWCFLSSLFSIHQITTFLHNRHFFLCSLCSSLTLSLSFLLAL